jgi:ADP-ribose pyrophosphatase YjhB (NUDIX family)
VKNPPTEFKTKKSHLGIYAVIEKGQSILLVKKSRGPYRGMWDLPGGRPIHGEAIFQTLQREVREETGIELIGAVPYANQAFVVEYEDGEEAISLHHTCLIYKATQFDSSQFRESINEEDVSGCAWIEKSQLARLDLSKVVLYAMCAACE